jgi:nicotinamide-nucleotide amidase
MRAEILATGDEIRSGVVVDTNSSFIALRLEEEGITVRRHGCVGDNIYEMAAALKEISDRSKLAVITGGLGPTDDDVTSRAVALAAGVELALNEGAIQSIDNFFKKRKRLYSSANKKQALLPVGSVCISNPVGTAPGFHIEIQGCTIFCLPGVPHEMKRMLTNDVIPLIRKNVSHSGQPVMKKRITIFGMTEANVAESLTRFGTLYPQLSLGLCAEFPVITVRVRVRHDIKGIESSIIEDAAKWIKQCLGDRILSMNGKSMAEVVGDLMRKRKFTLGVAESCTGGLIANMLTDVAGSSDYFKLSAVTYSNQSKVRILGVDPRTIERSGAVHEDTAVEMAAGIRTKSEADFGLSTTGIAGPSGGTVEKPVGTVCIGLSSHTGTEARRYQFRLGNRDLHKKIFAYTALNMLRKRLIKQSANH